MNRDSVYDFDATKLSVHTLDIGLAGIEVYDILRDEYDIQIEFGDIGNILAYLSIGDRKQEVERLVSALADIKRRYQKDKTGMLTAGVHRPRGGDDAPGVLLRAKGISSPSRRRRGGSAASSSCAIRRASLSWLRGRRSPEEIMEYILYAKEKGCSMTGPEDPKIERLNVVTGE